MSMGFPSAARGGPRARAETILAQLAGPWWMFLITGVAWLVIALIVLRFRLKVSERCCYDNIGLGILPVKVLLMEAEKVRW